MITSEIPKLKYFHHFDQSELNPSFHRKYFVNNIGDRMTINQDEIEKKNVDNICHHFCHQNVRIFVDGIIVEKSAVTTFQIGSNFPNYLIKPQKG